MDKLGQYGAIFIDNTNATAGPFMAIQVVTSAVVTTAVGNCTLSGKTLPVLAEPIRGHWPTITLASGSIIAYYAKDKA
jgi:hypothetical protein